MMDHFDIRLPVAGEILGLHRPATPLEIKRMSPEQRENLEGRLEADSAYQAALAEYRKLMDPIVNDVLQGARSLQRSFPSELQESSITFAEPTRTRLSVDAVIQKVRCRIKSGDPAARSQNRTAKELGCSPSTLRKAMEQASDVRDWVGAGADKKPASTSQTMLPLAPDAAVTRAPDDELEPPDVQRTLEKLISQLPANEQEQAREKLRDLSYEDRAKMARWELKNPVPADLIYDPGTVRAQSRTARD